MLHAPIRAVRADALPMLCLPAMLFRAYIASSDITALRLLLDIFEVAAVIFYFAAI